MSGHEKLISLPMAAKICSVSRWALWSYVKSGELNTSRTPGGHHRISKRDLEKFILKKGMERADSGQVSLKKILVVDDDEKIRKLLQLTLNGNGYQMEYASDGFEAGKKISTFHPHLVILDLMMPGIDGFKVCGQIKNDINTEKTKIIAISGFDTTENRRRILAYGADLFLPKPLDIASLKEEIKKILE